MTAPPSSGLVTRSRVVRVTTPTAPKSKFELEQNAFEQWRVNKLKMEEEKRKAEQEQESQKAKDQKEKGTFLSRRTNLKTDSAEKAKWAHVEWLQQKEKENKEKAEKEKKRKQVNEKMKTKTEQG